MKKVIFFIASCMVFFTGFSQLNIHAGTTFKITSGAYVALRGDVTSETDITGNGVISFKGSSPQQINMNGHGIPYIFINNTGNLILSNPFTVNKQLTLIKGKIILGDHSLHLSNTAYITGGGTQSFVETNGSGQLRKHLTWNLQSFNFPVGSGSNYTPITVTSSGAYSIADIGAFSKSGAHPHKPSSADDYLDIYWGVSRTGVTGNVSAIAAYSDNNVVGNEADLKAYRWNGSAWSSSGASINTATNQVTSLVNAPLVNLYAMSTIAGNPAVIADDESVSGKSALGRIFPNPAGAETFLVVHEKTGGAGYITITDVNGRLIRQSNKVLIAGINKLAVDLTNIPPGVYQVQLRIGSSTKNFKVIRK